MKIGFFGDSFCEVLTDLHSWHNKYTPYLKQIKHHYDAEIVHLGVGGSSIWDVIIKQFPPFQDNLPDVCVFCWTDPSRIYHPIVRNMGHWLTQKKNWKDINPRGLWNYKEYRAAREYFNHLYDHDKNIHECISAFYYFDREVLRSIQHKTKIIHLWSFGIPGHSKNNNPYYPSNITYIYDWLTGTEIRPSLNCFSVIGKDVPYENDLAANHLGSVLNNKLVSDLIIEAIDTHANGQLLIKDAMWEQSQTTQSAN